MSEAGRRAALIVFAKAPIPGRVKTRLASELGDDRAARLYESMGRSVVDHLRGGPYRMVVYFDPPEEEPRIREWIGDGSGEEFLPQAAGNLGARLQYAFSWGFERADVVCVVGTDIPELTRSDVEGAIDLLTSDPSLDVVLGPARDGGYYLLGLREPHPELFEDVPWSTDAVLATTLVRAKELDMTTYLLRTLVDVDSPSDLEDVVSRLPGLGDVGSSS